MKESLTLLSKLVGKLPEIPVPRAFLCVISFLLLGSLILKSLLWFIAYLVKLWHACQDLIPRFSDVERQRARQRRAFISHIQGELQRLDNLETWQDYRFAELEADVEVEGSRFGILSLIGLQKDEGRRRETSLSKALRRSNERLILVEGEPGAGKSVALRHVARKLAVAASRKQDPDATVPIYINLKEFDVDAATVSHHEIQQFVTEYINRVNRHDVEEFLDRE
jgi:hypothetical protein